MTLRPSLLPLFCAFSGALFAQNISYHIKTDQFGYLPGAVKTAVIADPQTGFNAAESYTPGSTLQLRREADNTVAFSAAPVAWKNGATDAISGDRVWWFDFSSVDVPGEYHVFDPANNTRSETFRIAGDVYDAALKTALRTFYYQRCGVPKTQPYAGDKWTDAAPCHISTNQDTQCRLKSNPTPASALDLSGGWHDAGDYNKYVNFARNPVLDFVRAYLERPAAFGDDCGIPESGNGVPDLLDELKRELDWLLKMQRPDGGVLCVVGGGDQSPPSADAAPRYYGPATTSASFSAAAMFAAGSFAFATAGNMAYADALKTAAASAWDWAVAHPGVKYYNTGVLAAGEQEMDDYGLYTSRLCAAVYLYDITGDAGYRNWVENNWQEHHFFMWNWVNMYELSSIEALLHFAGLPGVSGALAGQILSTFSGSASSSGDYLGGYNNQSDPYRAHLGIGNYVWGSNQIKSRIGQVFADMITYDLNPSQHDKFRAAAAGYLHYIHGVNPFGLCFLTNTAGIGAGNSAREMYHVWFGDGTEWDNADTSPKGPAPGFLTGGPNRYYSLDGCCPSNCGSPQNNALCAVAAVQPPLDQPAMKAYRDWNTSWPQNSWQITEPAIYYQAAYLRLLSHFVQPASTGVENPVADTLDFQLFPNPTSGECRIRLYEEPVDTCLLRVSDTAGKVLIEQPVSGTETLLDLRGLASGVYFVEIRSGQERGVRRLVVGQ